MCNKHGFGHIHTHSEYSTLDGAARVAELIQVAKEMGQDFIALSDHGSMSGLWVAQQECDKQGIKLIHACEFYYVRENDGKNGHLLIMAKNNKGLENMMLLHEYAYVNGFYYKPRINWDVLKDHSEGLIVTSTCLGSAFNQMLIAGDTLGAIAWAKKFKEVFKDDFYIEIQPNKIIEQHTCNVGAIRIAKQLGIKIVATNDVHYTYQSDCFSHEVLLALQLNKKMSDEKRFKFETDDFWLKSEEEMVETFDMLDAETVAIALQNTREIADKCNARIEKGNYLPSYYDVPQGDTERSVLVRKVSEGAKRLAHASDKEYMEFTQGEIDVIDRNGYSGYFLIVQDYVNTARRNGIIVGDGRGSGAGSKTAYLTGITTVEPTQFDLVFERFMADGRQPDFDVDFSDQDAVFSDLQKKYGVANVARIIAFGTLTPKAVIRKVLNVFEHSPSEIGQITKLVPDLCPDMATAYRDAPELLKIKDKYRLEFGVIERLEGIVSHESQHAGGVIIYPNLSSFLPVKSKSEDRTKRIVAFDKYMLEDLGHYKFDVLGLETLPIIRRALDSIREQTGQIIDLDSIDFEDQKVYDMLCEGDVSGVFQINNQAGKVVEQQPRNFRDLIAINAMIRPGVGDWNEYIARRRGKPYEIHPLREKIYRETYGVLAYQEQFMLDCVNFAGWDIAYADKKIRKNKDLKGDVELKAKFIKDCLSRGHNEGFVLTMWKEFEDATGDYSFCKAHAAMYGRTAFKTAWLKCYYPEHFYASLMTSEGDDQNAVAGYVAECKKRGINILPPDINHSTGDFVVGSAGINYRITTIRHVGESAINHIEQLRPISSFGDFLERREKSQIKRNVLESLIKAGCFDFDNPNRAELLWQVDQMNRTKTQIKEGYDCPQYEWNDKQKAEWERDSLGMYISVHPMEKYGFKPLDSFAEESIALVGGEVLEVVTRNDKSGKEMAFVTIGTLYGNVRVLVFAYIWSRIENKVTFVQGKLVMVKGKKSGDAVLMDKAEVLT